MAVIPVVLKVETALAACRGDPALALTLIDQYRTSLPEERAALVRAQAVTPPDWEAVRQRVHRLQSGGGYLGVERIAVAAQRLEAEIFASCKFSCDRDCPQLSVVGLDHLHHNKL